MNLSDLPVSAGSADSEGLNHALNAIVVDSPTAKGLAALLEQNPRGVIRRAILLNRYQNASLAEMSDQEVSTLVKPVIGALRGPNALKMRLRITEQITTNSPLSIHCSIDIET
jgi:hypothetical protein